MRVLLISLLSLATVAATTVPAISADMIQGYERPPLVKHRSRPVNLDCSDMIVEYRYIPRTEVVTVCHRVR